jgi:hypothetical protein
MSSAASAARAEFSRRSWAVIGLLAMLLLVGAALGVSRPSTTPSGPAAFGGSKLPLGFVPNRGQTDPRVRFLAQTQALNVFVARDETVLQLARGEHRAALGLSFPGARARPAIVAGSEGRERVNYIRGGTRLRTYAGLPSYGTVTYRDLWPGVDMTLRGGRGPLKYEFRLAPGVDPETVRISLRGADRLALGGAGQLLVGTPVGTLVDAAPRTYQVIDGHRVPRSSRFRLGGDSRYGFAVGSYDRSRPLVIDPGLAYSTFLGGSDGEPFGTWGVAVDGAGNAITTGATVSPDFPTTPGAYDETFNGGSYDAFVTKLNATGSDAIWSTFIGGAGTDAPGRPVIDAEGNVFVPGVAGGSDFPTTPGAYDTTFNGGGGDGFFLELDPTGSKLLYSTLLGGSGFDGVSDAVLGPSGEVTLGGSTGSGDFPTTSGAFQTTANNGQGAGFRDNFVTKLNVGGTGLVYSTYLGGSDEDQFRGLAVDGDGNATVTGFSYSADFPTTPGAVQPTFGGAIDATVTKLPATGTGLVYSTYLGGSDGDYGLAIAGDSDGNAYVTGYTGGDFPTTPGAFQTSPNGLDAFVTKLGPTGAVIYSTYLGAEDYDQGLSIKVDSARRAYVAGRTASTDFPTTPDAYDQTFNGGFYNPFLSVLDAFGSTLIYSTYFGGGGSFSFSQAQDVAIDGSGGAYLAGFTETSSFPTTEGAFDRTFGGSNEGFVAKLDLPVQPESTPGCKLSGGGRMIAANGDRGAFNNSVHVGPQGVRGRVIYADPGPVQPFRLDSRQILALVCSDERTATVLGNAVVDGSNVSFRIEAVDRSSSGRNDSYRIVLSNGYDSGLRRLERGNVQIRFG